MLRRKKYDYDLIVLGSGAGGGVAAHVAKSLGKKVAVFDSGTIGGECPSFACIPTKALLQSAETYEIAKNANTFGIHTTNVSCDFSAIHKRKNLVVSRTGATHGAEVFEGNGIHLIRHKASFIFSHTIEAGGKSYSAEKFVIATGSTALIPPIEGLEDAGYITFKQAVDLKSPPKSLLIIGGGAVACEFAQIYNSFGTKVTMIVRSTLLSNEDSEVIALIQALFESKGIKVLTNAGTSKVTKKGEGKEVLYTQDGKEHTITVEEILVATGKKPVLSFHPERVGIKVDKTGIKVNKYLQTSVKHIYAAGDVVGPYLFTHTGYYQGGIAGKNAFSNKKTAVNYTVVPRCVFLNPEVASVGMSEQDATQKGIKIKKGLAAIGVLGRANTSEEFNGFIKVITDNKGIIIGASIVAPRAGEMIHEFALAMHARVKSQVLASMIHAYPTYSEAIKIACSNVS